MKKQILTVAAALAFIGSCTGAKPRAAGHAGQSSFRVSSWGHDDASRRISDPASASVEQSSAADSTRGFVCLDVRTYDTPRRAGTRMLDQD